MEEPPVEDLEFVPVILQKYMFLGKIAVFLVKLVSLIFVKNVTDRVLEIWVYHYLASDPFFG